MGIRRQARERALQILYEREINPESIRETELYWEVHPARPDVRDYAEHLLDGVLAFQAEIDALLEESSDHWRLGRIGNVERNLLRTAVFELAFDPAVPPKVAIDEALEIAKKYGGSESGKFVNGVLDRIKRQVEAEPAGSQGDADSPREIPSSRP